MDQFLDELSWEQLEELRAFARIEGYGEDRADARFAFMLSVLCAHFGVEASPESFLYQDQPEEEAPKESPEITAARVAAAIGAVRM